MTKHESIALTVSEKVKIENGEAHDNGEPVEEESNVNGDRMNILVLYILYTMQNIPNMINFCLPLLLQKRGASYETQAGLSFTWWPFAVKLLWAPIVDSCYSARFGRRKSWLVPMQYAIAAVMLFISFYAEEWLGDKGKPANFAMLGGMFFTLMFFVAVQDVSLDGWALTMLKRRNLGYAAMCGSIGHATGAFIGYTMLISLESKDFCNTWLRSEPKDYGVLNLSGFLWFWGITYIIVTSLLAVLKREDEGEDDDTSNKLAASSHDHDRTSVLDTYKLIWKILNIPSMRILAILMLTQKLSWVDYDGVAYLKFLDTGVSSEKMNPLMAIGMTPTRFIIPFLVVKFLSGAKPIQAFIAVIPYRSLLCLTGALIIWVTPKTLSAEGEAPNYIYFVYMANDILYMSFMFTMRVTLSAAFMKISDPAVGGTYLTMLYTMDNIGGTWPISLALWMVERLTWRDCSASNIGQGSYLNGTDIPLVEPLKKCPIIVDGYYIETVFCFIFGLFWCRWGLSKLRYLQRLPIEAWRVSDYDHSKKLYSTD